MIWCVCVCIFKCMYIYMYIYIYTYWYIHISYIYHAIYNYIYIYIYTSIYIYIIHIYVDRYIYIYIHVWYINTSYVYTWTYDLISCHVRERVGRISRSMTSVVLVQGVEPPQVTLQWWLQGLALEKQSNAPSSALNPCERGPPGTSSSSVSMTRVPRREKPWDESCSATSLTLMEPSYILNT